MLKLMDQRNSAQFHRAPAHAKYPGLLGNVVHMKSLPKKHRASQIGDAAHEPQKWAIAASDPYAFETFGVSPSFFTELQPWTNMQMRGGYFEKVWDASNFPRPDDYIIRKSWELCKRSMRWTSDIVEYFCYMTDRVTSEWTAPQEDPLKLAKKDNLSQRDHRSLEYGNDIAYFQWIRSVLSSDHKAASNPVSSGGISTILFSDNEDSENEDLSRNGQSSSLADYSDDETIDEPLDAVSDSESDWGYDVDECVCNDPLGHRCSNCSTRFDAMSNLASICDWVDEVEMYRIGNEWMGEDAVQSDGMVDEIEVVARNAGAMAWYYESLHQHMRDMVTREQGGLIRWAPNWLCLQLKAVQSKSVQLSEFDCTEVIGLALSSAQNLELKYIVRQRLLIFSADKIANFEAVRDDMDDAGKKVVQRAQSEEWWMPDLMALGTPARLACNLPIIKVTIDNTPEYCEETCPSFVSQVRVDPGMPVNEWRAF